MLPKISTIVYACDLEDHTKSTLELVLSLANTHKAKVILMHVIEPLSSQAVSMIGNYIPDDVIQTMRTDTKNETDERMKKMLSNFMEEHAEELSSLETLPETCNIYGRPAESIETVAKEKQADLIVMNSRTHNKFEQLLLGSTANKVIHSSTIPVLVVPIK